MKTQKTNKETANQRPRIAKHLARLLAAIVVGLTASLIAPRTAHAMPPLTPIEDKEPYNLNDGEWSVLWEIQQQCYEITAGTRTSTKFTFDGPTLLGGSTWSSDSFDMSGWDGYTDAPQYCATVLQNRASDSIRRIVEVISIEKPSVIAWLDDEGWNSVRIEFHVSLTADGGWAITAGQGFCSVSVAPYCSAGDYEVSPDSMRRVRESLDFAQGIADRCQIAGVRNRLDAYNDAIQSLTSYHEGVVGRYGTYSLDWSFLSVFDNDPSTKSVCVAYSRALKVLFELSGETEAKCYIMRGYDKFRGASGGHMWNTVRLGGHNYLADTTNSHDGSLGARNIYIVPAYGSVESGYDVPIPGYGSFTITYDDDLTEVFKRDYLVLSDTPYEGGEESINAPDSSDYEDGGDYEPHVDERRVARTPGTQTQDNDARDVPSPIEGQQEGELVRRNWTLDIPHAKTHYITPELFSEDEETPKPTGDEWVVPVSIAVGLLGIAFAPVIVLRSRRARR